MDIAIERLKRIVARFSNRGLPLFGILIGAVGVALVFVFAGFLYMQSEQGNLAAIREHTRLLRSARMAIMETNTNVLTTLSQPDRPPALLDYLRSLETLEKHGDGDFPKLTNRLGGAPVPTPLVLAELKSAWSDAMEQVTRKDHRAANDMYFGREVPSIVTDITRSTSAELDELDRRYSTVYDRLNFISTAVLLLQILSGIICVIIFRGGAVRSKREAVTRALAVKEANQSREQVSRLFEMADMLQSATDYSDANSILRSSAAELIFGFSGALYVFNNSRDRLVLSTSWERDGFDALPETLGLDECWALKRGKSHINRPHSRKLCCSHHNTTDHALEIPMLARGEILGLLQIYADGDEAEERLLKVKGLGMALADAMSLALSNIALREKLRGQALRDPLTGLYNRRYMEDALERFARLAEREGREFSVIMIDLDHFKRLNDQFGHAKGDAVLRDSAALIVHQLRETDVACRYGGEELIVLLPDCGLEMAASKAEQIRMSIESLSQANGARVSASLGVASTPAASSKDLIALADAALYQAKQEGRNRVVRASQRPQDAKRRRGKGHDAEKPSAEILLAAE